MAIRLATPADREALLDIVKRASPGDPIYLYRYPYRQQYPEDFTRQYRQKCNEYISQNTVVVYEIPDPDAPGQTKVVAFAVWEHQQPVEHAQARSQPAMKKATIQAALSLVPAITKRPSHDRHANPRRVEAVRTSSTKAKTDFFDNKYAKRGHLFLKLLLCHPGHQRRGYGRALTRWGVRRAWRHRLNTTLFASPMGFGLYSKLGFREVGDFKVQVAGEKDQLRIPAMVLEFKELHRSITA